MNIFRTFISQYMAPVLLSVAALAILSSCSVTEDLKPCLAGIEMRFIYDYNIEEANAFHNQVDCITLHIYDGEGRFVATRTETSDVLADESWRMRLELEPGSYHAVAYGGIACDKASFAHRSEPSEGSDVSDIEMQLKQEHVGTRLHDHYHGTVDFVVEPRQDIYTEVTLPLTRTTNHFRILLHNLDMQPVDGRDFDFEIVDDNSLLDHRNNPVTGHPVSYPAWTSGAEVPSDEESRAGEDSDIQPVQLGYAELSTSRIMLGSGAQLRIRLRETGEEIVRLPLPSYLVLGRSEDDPWGKQEFLDRCSRWNMTFFLDRNNQWVKTHIIVNNWTVRINDHEF